MKRLSTVEYWVMLLGSLFIVVGMVTIIWPVTGVMFHLANDAIGLNTRDVPELVTATSSRVYGVLTVLIGGGMVAAAIYRERK